MKTIAGNIIAFNESLDYSGKLPEGFMILNPFKDNPETVEVMTRFYRKFYNDNRRRRFIMGINPGRHGAGLTGIPFTDTRRLDAVCGIKMNTAHSHEPSSVFIYEMIGKYGGVEKFYGDFYINSPFPLAIVRRSAGGKWLNANYYDDKKLFEALKPFMVTSLRQQISIGLQTGTAYILGKKNAGFLEKINREEKLFDRFIVLEHPRFIQQYKSVQKDEYINKYLQAMEQQDP